MFKLQNSYGKEWGDGGFGWIPFEYLTNPRLAGDFWAVRG
jgi:C1A family cysteine protease